MSAENIDYASATIVDVRSKLEFMMGHVEGSINIPLNQVPEKIEEFKTMNRPLILCCKSGNRSGQAIQYLESHGVTDLHNGGGWTDVNQKL